MKYLSKLFSILAVALLAVACSDDIPGGEIVRPLETSTPVVSAVKGTTAVVSTTVTGSAIISRGVCYSTSPAPAVAMPGLPVELKYTLPVGVTMAE